MHIGFILAFLTSLLVGQGSDVRVELVGKNPRIVRVQRRDGALRVELLGVTVQTTRETIHRGVVDSWELRQSGDFAVVDARVSSQPRIALRQESERTVLVLSTHDLVHNPPFEFDHEELSSAVARMAAALDCHYVLEPRAAHLIVTGVFENDDPLVSLRSLASKYALEVKQGQEFVAVGSAKSLRALSMESIGQSFALGPQVRQEILLEHVPATELLPKLRRAFKHVHFQVAPHLNGFYVSGPLKDILRLKSEMGKWDMVAQP